MILIQDPISDMLTRIRNALMAQKREVVLPYSRFKQNLGEVLVREGWLERGEVVEDGKFKSLRLHLKYDPTGLSVISGISRISKPGQRIYAKNSKFPPLRFGKGITIVSTSQGLMTDKEARRAKVGGEVVCQIW